MQDPPLIVRFSRHKITLSKGNEGFRALLSPSVVLPSEPGYNSHSLMWVPVALSGTSVEPW